MRSGMALAMEYIASSMVPENLNTKILSSCWAMAPNAPSTLKDLPKFFVSSSSAAVVAWGYLRVVTQYPAPFAMRFDAA